MSKIENINLWETYIELKKKEQVIFYKLSQISIDEKIELLQEAFRRGDEAECFFYLSEVEPLDSKESKRPLTIGLLDFIILTAIYPGNYEVNATNLLKALVKNHNGYGEIICNKVFNKLDEPEYFNDEEVYHRVGNLLYYFNSNLFEQFLARCRSHKNLAIKELSCFFTD
jgi:hypothetical protein